MPPSLAMRKVFNLRKLLVATELALSFETVADDDGKTAFRKVEFSPSFRETVGVAWADNDSFKPFSQKAKLSHEKTRASGVIDSSPYGTRPPPGFPPPWWSS